MKIIESRKPLGETGLLVSELCLGVLPMGPLHIDMPQDACVELIQKALSLGVNFLDTAEMYKTQPYIGEVLQGQRSRVILSSKSMADSYDDMARSVEKSLEEMKTDYIDIYHLHAPNYPGKVIHERKGALKFLEKMKLQKVIRNIGVATHHPETVIKGAERDDIDVIFTLINKKGMGIIGSVADMLQAIKFAHAQGKGLYAMKVLAGGNLIPELEEAFRWVRAIEEMTSIAVGIVSEEELLMDLCLFGMIDIDLQSISVEKKGKKLLIQKKICKGCGRCVEKCPNNALYLEQKKAVVDHSKCLLCAYCGPACEEFAIRIT